jgi:hypothetical protein
MDNLGSWLTQSCKTFADAPALNGAGRTLT